MFLLYTTYPTPPVRLAYTHPQYWATGIMISIIPYALAYRQVLLLADSRYSQGRFCGVDLIFSSSHIVIDLREFHPPSKNVRVFRIDVLS